LFEWVASGCDTNTPDGPGPQLPFHANLRAAATARNGQKRRPTVTLFTPTPQSAGATGSARAWSWPGRAPGIGPAPRLQGDSCAKLTQAQRRGGYTAVPKKGARPGPRNTHLVLQAVTFGVL